MEKQLLQEHPDSEKPLLKTYSDFIPDPNLLKESIENPSKPFLVGGILQKCNAKNQNGRMYTKEVLQREVENYKNKFVKNRTALGELDHNDTSVVELKNVSHLITDLYWKGDDLYGVIEVLNTPCGNIAKELFKAKIPVGISSRALGNVKEVREGNMTYQLVQDDLVLCTFDFVADPSVREAYLSPLSSTLNEGVLSKSLEKYPYKNIEDIISNIFAELR